MTRRPLKPASLALLALAACGGDAAPVCEGDLLFGRPNERTGLTDEQCAPRCTCRGEPFEAPLYGDAEADALLVWQLAEPYAELTEDPYAEPPPAEPPPATVCAVTTADDGTYRLDSFASDDAARAAGAVTTHHGACGLCSPLADLAVYMRHPDLTEPVRTCGLESSDQAEHLACLEALGFTRPCAQIWYFNTLHTRDACILPCLAALDAPYHLPDGGLNDCLVCDEVESGPVFKAVAGRTRRNTGVASAMCRPCSEVQPLVHVYE
jgi:hypothetical protein